MLAAVSLMPAPVPNGEAEENAKNNYMWPDAQAAARAHKAHIMVAVLGAEPDMFERGRLYTKLLSACCRQKNALGVYTSGVVFEPHFYEDFSYVMKDGGLPIFNWIWFGLYRREGGLCGYTYGMDVFGKEEMEVLDTDTEPSELRDFLASLADYVLSSDVKLLDGETIGFAEDDRHTITLSQGAALPEQMTLKISYEPLDMPEEGAYDPFEMEGEETYEDVFVMDDAHWHTQSINEKDLPVEDEAAYNHMAIYLRWCIEHELLGPGFPGWDRELMDQYKNEDGYIDLRGFIRGELDGQLTSAIFSPQGVAFARYYYGEGDAPYFPSDIDDYALKYFGPARYYGDEFKDEAYLFIPFDEEYYQAMAKVIEKRWDNWQGQEIGGNGEPAGLAKIMMEYLGCECQYFPPMRDDDPLTSALGYARRRGVRDGYVPVLIRVDQTLLDCMIMNSDPGSRGGAFDPVKVAEYRRYWLSHPAEGGREILEGLAARRRTEAEEEGIDWQVLSGSMEGGVKNDSFISYWGSLGMTDPFILAKIPVRNPWQIFAYLPFGGRNECPGTPELMAITKYWFEKYGAVPSVMTHDELEFDLPAPAPKEQAMELAAEHYGFCPDLDGNRSLGALADTLRRSGKWYFWWD